MVLFVIIQIGVARVQNIGGFILLRFLSGVASSPPATLGAGTITDVSDPTLNIGLTLCRSGILG